MITDHHIPTATTLRSILPLTCRLQDNLVLLHKMTKLTPRSLDGSAEEIRYGKAMDALGLPGITVEESKPITVAFDWLASRLWSEDQVIALYALLAPVCSAYHSPLGRHMRPFALSSGRGTYQAVRGFKTVREAVSLADTIGDVSYRFLGQQIPGGDQL